ncbi:MAG: protein kinase [Chloroflexi bacterium]|nr:protein kinase [Chloroflexota bacterium]
MAFENLVGQTLGQYELRELLGAGGMGAVYRGYQTTLKREVAVKVLPAQLAQQPGYIERFTREAETAAALEHPHIVPIVDYGTQRGVSFVVMRLLPGGTLAERLAQREEAGLPLPSFEEITTLLKQIGSALDYAHAHGVIHRDIKPSNIMFDNHGNAYLVDFGIAKLLAGGGAILTATGMSMGTPVYMPPEQWRGEELTPNADQYALGIIAYAMLTGRVPFDAETPFALMHKHVNEAPTPITAWRSDAPAAVGLVLERALAKKPEDRFPTCTAFAQAFESAVTGVDSKMSGMFTFKLKPMPKPAPRPTGTPLPEYTPAGPNEKTITDSTPVAPPPAAPPPTAPIGQGPSGGGRNPLLWVIAVIVVLALIGGGALGINYINEQNAIREATQVAVNMTATATLWTPTPTPTNTPTPTATYTPSVTPTVEVTTLEIDNIEVINDGAARLITVNYNVVESFNTQMYMGASIERDGNFVSYTFEPALISKGIGTTIVTLTYTGTEPITSSGITLFLYTEDNSASFFVQTFPYEEEWLPAVSASGFVVRDTLSYGDSGESSLETDSSEAWEFEGQEGDVVNVSVRSRDLSVMTLEMYNADGTRLTYDFSSGEDFLPSIVAYILPADGTYTVVVINADSSNGDYEVLIDTIDISNEGRLRVGAVEDNEVEDVGGDWWSFQADAGDIVRITLFTEDFDLSNIMYLYAPDGVLVQYTYFNFEALVLPQDGTYRLHVRGTQQDTGTYTLSLSGGEGIVRPGVTTEARLSSGEVALWGFSARAGDVIAIETFSRDFDTAFSLYNSTGSFLFFNDNNNEGDDALLSAFLVPADDTYVVLVRSSDNNDGGDYELRVDESSAPLAGELNYGDVFEAEAEETGGNWYTFEGREGDAVAIAMAGGRGFDTYLVLYGPDNTIIRSDDDSGLLADSFLFAVLPADGTYTLVARAYFGTPGDYQLSLEQVDDISGYALSYVNPSGDVDVYDGPSRSRYDVVATLSNFEVFYVVGQSRDGDWYKIGSLSGEERWIAASEVVVLGTIDNIPVVDAP